LNYTRKTRASKPLGNPLELHPSQNSKGLQR